jgi:VWFA-related protein
VTDKDGRLMPDLERDVFEIRDNGKPQPLTVFSREVQPITVVTMLDRSGSMRGNVGLVEKAAQEFVRRLGPEDKARIGTFAERIQIQPEGFTNDREALLQVLQSDRPVLILSGTADPVTPPAYAERTALGLSNVLVRQPEPRR